MLRVCLLVFFLQVIALAALVWFPYYGYVVALIAGILIAVILIDSLISWIERGKFF